MTTALALWAACAVIVVVFWGRPVVQDFREEGAYTPWALTYILLGLAIFSPVVLLFQLLLWIYQGIGALLERAFGSD